VVEVVGPEVEVVEREEEEEEMGPCTDRWVWKFVCAVKSADLRA